MSGRRAQVGWGRCHSHVEPPGGCDGFGCGEKPGCGAGARGSLLYHALGVPKSAGAPGESALPAELGWKGEPGRQAPFFRGVSRVCAWVLSELAAQA